MICNKLTWNEEGDMNEDYLAILAHEFRGGDESFSLKLRIELIWDKAAFDRLTWAMRKCCEDYQYPQEHFDVAKNRSMQLTDEQFADNSLANELFMKDGSMMLPRWLVEGFWYVPQFVKNWASHPVWEKVRANEPEYYKKAYDRLDSLATWFFTGQTPWMDVEKGWRSTFV